MSLMVDFLVAGRDSPRDYSVRWCSHFQARRLLRVIITCFMSQQDGQCTYNVTLRRVRESLLPWKSNKYYMLVCWCMRARACVRACGYRGAWTCACAYVHVVLLIQHATRMCHIVTSFVALRSALCFSTWSHSRCDFRKKKLLNIKRVFWFAAIALNLKSDRHGYGEVCFCKAF